MKPITYEATHALGPFTLTGFLITEQIAVTESLVAKDWWNISLYPSGWTLSTSSFSSKERAIACVEEVAKLDIDFNACLNLPVQERRGIPHYVELKEIIQRHHDDDPEGDEPF